MKIKLTRKKTILLILGLTLIVLLMPFILRWLSGNTVLMGDYSYHHYQLSEKPNLLFQSKFFTPYDLILFVLNSIIKNTAWSVILPVLLGLGTVLLFNNFLKRFDLTNEQKFLILVFFVLSPAFIYFFTFSNQYSLIVFLLILIVHFLNIKNNLKFLAIPPLLLMPFFDILTTVITLSLLLIYWVLKKKDKPIIYLLVGLFLLAVIIQLFYPQPWTYEPITKSHFFADFFSDLGSLKGFSLFYLLSAVIGLIATWKQRRIYYFAYPAIILLMLLFYFVNTNITVYLNFILAFFSGLGLMWLWQRKWKLNFLRVLSIMILLAGLILSTVGELNQINQMPPNNFIKESLGWLKDYSQPEEIVLSHQSKSFWIKTMADRPAFLDVYEENYHHKLNITADIFYSRDIKLTTDLLEEYKIKYIWIDAEMLRGQVWTDEDEGLLFLFRNPRFRNIYNKRGIEIWRFD